MNRQLDAKSRRRNFLRNGQVALLAALLQIAPSFSADPVGGIVEVDLKADVFRDESPSVLGQFNTSNNLTGDANYKKLFKDCKGYENSSDCMTMPAVFGVVNRTDANVSTQAMNRMLILNPNGSRVIRDVEVAGGKLKYDSSLVKANRLGIITLTYFRADPTGGDKSPFLRCEAEVIVCSPEMAACPQAEPSRCVPTVSASNKHTTTTSSCKCDGPNEGKVLERCVQNVPTCVPPKGCAVGEVRMPNGACLKQHECSLYATELATLCEGKFKTATLTGGFPETLSCPGTWNDPSCITPPACAMNVSLSSFKQPTSATAVDGTATASASAGIGNVTFSLSAVSVPTQQAPASSTATSATFGELAATKYRVTATDSATPVACTKSFEFDLGSSSNPVCSTAPLCTDPALTSNYCPGTEYRDGCGNICGNPGTKVAGCTTPPALVCSPAMLVPNDSAWTMVQNVTQTSGITAMKIDSALPGTNKDIVLPVLLRGGGMTFNEGQKYHLICGPTGVWTFQQEFGTMGTRTPTGCNAKVPAEYGLPSIEYSVGLDPNGQPCGKAENSEGPGDMSYIEQFEKWVAMPAGEMCTSVLSGTVGSACPLATAPNGQGQIAGFRMTKVTYYDTDPGKRRVLQNDRWKWKEPSATPDGQYCICR